MPLHHLLHRFIRTRPHLSVAILLGIAAALLLPPSLGPVLRALLAWNGAVWFYLITMAWLMMRADQREVRVIAQRQDESAGLVLATLTIAAVMSLTAIISELTSFKGLSLADREWHYGFTALTIFGSWFLVGTLFAIHYAHLYYHAPADAPPLRFTSDHAQPDYWDFLYFSFTIAVAAQTADVTVATRAMRKLVLGQAVLSFFFNLAVLGLSINIAAGLINA